MQTIKISLLILICIALLGGCGLKGPLYLPGENPVSDPGIESEPTAETDAEDTRKDAEDNTRKASV